MAGWICKECQAVRTFRRPPFNTCLGCRSSKRGRHNCKRGKTKTSVRPNSKETGNKDAEDKVKKLTFSVPSSRVRQKSSPAKAVSKVDCYVAMKESLNKECQENLVPALGLTDAYLAAAQAMSVVDRYKRDKLPLPACHRSLVSFSMAMSPIADEDLKRALYLHYIGQKISVEQMRAGECMWTMTLPFKHKHTDPS